MTAPTFHNGPVTLTLADFEVTVYTSEVDGKPVVQIDGGGDLRVYVNDGAVFDQPTDQVGRIDYGPLNV